MNKLFVLLFSCILLAFVGCASTDQAGSIATEVSGETLINHQAKALGSEVPEWVQKVIGGTRKDLQNDYPDAKIFTSTSRGENLDALKFWANTFDVNTTVASELNTYFSNEAGSISNASATELIRTADQLAAVSSTSRFNGLSKEAEYWLLWETADGDKVYDYYVLYTISNQMFDESLDRILADLDEEARSVATPVYDRIKEEGLFNN